jgi:hypothetical protein
LHQSSSPHHVGHHHHIALPACWLLQVSRHTAAKRCLSKHIVLGSGRARLSCSRLHRQQQGCASKSFNFSQRRRGGLCSVVGAAVIWP